MRRLIAFPCAGEMLGGTLDAAPESPVGVLMATGGSQTRIGSHRMYERLANHLAMNGISCFRFDRRGVGDASGDDPGFRDSGTDLVAAAEAFRASHPALSRLIGFGLCDGATALALHGDTAGLQGLILVNPWLVEAEADTPPPAAIRHHYRQRLLSLDGWKRLLTGSISYRKLLRGIFKAWARADASLAGDTAAALARHRIPAHVILARDDATAVAAAEQMKSALFKGLIGDIRTIDSDSHTFARPGDDAALADAALGAVRTLARARD
jgi:exosortase A-associated hydrolase 1